MAFQLNSCSKQIYPTAFWFLAAFLNFSPTFNFFLKIRIFFHKNQFTECKNLHSLIFAEFPKIRRQKSAILDCAAILKDFQNRSSAKS
jgi:hypothetical protein